MLILVLLVGWIASAFFCAEVADEKGYSGTSWGIAGFIFGFFALIAVAGLPDKKLRKYIRLMGEKQNAISTENELSQKNIIDKETMGIINSQFGSKERPKKRRIQFVMPTAANKLQVFNKLKSEFKKNEEYEQIFDGFKIKSYDFHKSLLGGLEFVIEGDEDESLFIMTSKKFNDVQTQWIGEF